MKLGEKSILIALPVVIVAVLLHFIYYMVEFGASKGFLGGLATAITYILVALLITIVYTFLTKKKEKALTGFFSTLSIVILGNLLLKLIQMTPLLSKLGIAI